MNESIQSRFAFRLKEMRENRNLSQAALSKRLSISQSTVASWEVGTEFTTYRKCRRLFRRHRRLFVWSNRYSFNRIQDRYPLS